jgi:phage terminase small subunit
MPARKSLSLNKSHLTKKEKADRESAESALSPVTQITSRPPKLLDKHKYAKEMWRRLIGLFFETKDPIITAFDEDLLAKYCLLEEECVWLEGKRDMVDKAGIDLNKKMSKLELVTSDDYKIYYNLVEQFNAMIARVQGLDARLDGKRKLVHTLAQSLYLTPRSRAGAKPDGKQKEKPDGFGDEFD